MKNIVTDLGFFQYDREAHDRDARAITLLAIPNCGDPLFLTILKWKEEGESLVLKAHFNTEGLRPTPPHNTIVVYTTTNLVKPLAFLPKEVSLKYAQKIVHTNNEPYAARIIALAATIKKINAPLLTPTEERIVNGTALQAMLTHIYQACDYKTLYYLFTY